jgi:hypothetical protein
MITMERAHYLYALLIEASINYGSLVTTTMMTVRHTDKSIVLPYGALITRIVEHVEVSTEGMREVHLEKAPINAHFLNASNAHLQEAEQEQRPRRPSRTTQADGATTRMEEHLDRIEASLRELHVARAKDYAILE